jgi:integrase
MRRTELLALPRRQIDFLCDSIKLTTATKSGRLYSIPIHSDLKPVMQRPSDESPDSGYLFANPKTGKPIRTIKTVWQKTSRNTGIPYFNFPCAGHHTFGTRAVDGDAPVSTVKEVMRHMDINLTRRYVHASDEGRRRAVELAAKGRVQSVSATNLPQANTA